MLADLADAPQALAKLQENDRENPLLTALREALATRVAPDGPRAHSQGPAAAQPLIFSSIQTRVGKALPSLY